MGSSPMVTLSSYLLYKSATYNLATLSLSVPFPCGDFMDFTMRCTGLRRPLMVSTPVCVRYLLLPSTLALRVQVQVRMQVCAPSPVVL